MTPQTAPIAPAAPAIAERARRAARHDSAPRRIIRPAGRLRSAAYPPRRVAGGCAWQRAAINIAATNTTGAPGSAPDRRPELLHP
jgi:hypothetical protein